MSDQEAFNYDPRTIRPEIVQARLLGEIVKDWQVIKLQPDPLKQIEMLHQIGSHLEFAIRLIPELSDILGIGFLNLDISEDQIARKMRAMREDGDSWRLGDLGDDGGLEPSH